MCYNTQKACGDDFMTKIINSVKISDEDLKILGEDDKNFTAQLKNFLLTGDNVRAGLDPYDENILFDPNRGHWDLWDFDREGGKEFQLEENFVARDPASDVSTGIVGQQANLQVNRYHREEWLLPSCSKHLQDGTTQSHCSYYRSYQLHIHISECEHLPTSLLLLCYLLPE